MCVLFCSVEGQLVIYWQGLGKWTGGAETGAVGGEAPISVAADVMHRALSCSSQALVRQFEMIRQMQTNEGITLLDKNDTFFTAGYSFAGVYDAMQAFAEQISGATGIPLVRLLGQSPKGFSSGESDLRTYYDTITTLWHDDLRPVLEVLFAVLARNLWGEGLPDGFAFECESLMQPSETDKAQIATADAQAVAALTGGGIITPSQGLAALRDSARLTGRFSSITDADIARAEAAEQAPALPTIRAAAFSPLEMGNGAEPDGTA